MIKFCSQCGGGVSKRIPAGDERLRHVCDSCDHIHYVNPRIIAGVLPIHGQQVLLCKRAIEPRKGYWTLPAGFLENNETTQQGAERETWEEARAKLRDVSLYRLFDLPHISQVYMFYRATLTEEGFGVGPESLETALFNEADIPWQELAFPVITETLQDFFADRKASSPFAVKISTIDIPALMKQRGNSNDKSNNDKP